MNEENQRKPVDGCSGGLVDNMGGSSLNNTNMTSSASHPEKRTLPLLYVQSPKNLNTSELTSSYGVPKVLSTPVTSVSNGVNGGKTIQAFVGTLINKKCQQKVLLTPVKPGNEKQTGMARVLTLAQGQRSGSGIGQVTRLSAVPTTQAGGGQNSSLSVILPAQGKQICTSYVVSPVSSTNSATISSAATSNSNNSTNNGSSPLISSNRTLSIRNAILIDSANNNSQNKTAQPNIIRQKVSADGKITVSSLLKPSGLSGAALLSKVLATPSQQAKITGSSSISQSMAGDSKREEGKELTTSANEVVLIEDDDNDNDDEDGNTSNKTNNNNSSSQDNSTPKQNTLNSIHKDSGTFESKQETESRKIVTSSPIGDRARKRKGLIAISEPPNKLPKHQDKIKLLPGAEDFDPFKVVEWEQNGIGLLPGSNIKMTVNELGMLTVAEDTLAERGATPSTSAAEDEGKTTPKKANELDSILCCVCCSCYGLPAEFYNPSYCSISCRDAVLAQEESIVKKIEQEQEQNSDGDQKKKRKTAEALRKHPLSTEISTATIISNNEEKETRENVDKMRKITTAKTVESESEDEKRIPGFMEDVLKQQSSNEEEFNAAILKAKKIVKKGKILNSDLKFQKSITKLIKPDTKNASYANSDVQNNDISSLTKSSKAEPKQKSILAPLPNDVSKNKPNKSSIKSPEIVKVKSVAPIKFKSYSLEISQDLDCGKLTPNRLEKSDSSVDQFPWGTYLKETGSRPAWVKLFNNPFPTGVNLFQVGYKLEAIDPEHQSNICAVTVVRIKGYRIKLHFDCYSDIFDFWTNVDSPNIFPCGFCARHGISLSPPQGHSKETFNWLSYNSIWRAVAAPTTCFPNYSTSTTSPNLFRVGMKLEAVDRKNTFLVCVATVAGVLENKIMVHFDSWGDVYDYWVDTSSPYIRPIGWCKENNHELTPPNGIKPTEFSWSEYLEKTKSEAAPARAFTLRPHNEFRRGMKLEAIDKRASHLLRVATVKEVLPYQIKIVFDGFPDQFGYWVDDDCPDVHPVGWAANTGHSLEPPPSINAPSPCPTPGCLGQGNLRNNASEIHCNLEDCPYSIDHLNIETLIPDRLSNANSSDINKGLQDEVINLDNDDESADEEDDINKKRWSWLGVREGIREVKHPEKAIDIKKPLPKKIKRRKKRRRSIKNVSENTSENEHKPEDWKNSELLKCESDPMKWTCKQVIEFASSVLGTIEPVDQLENEEVNGKAFLMLKKDDLKYYLGFKEESAVKLSDTIFYLRSKVT